MPPRAGSYSYLLRDPVGISTRTMNSSLSTAARLLCQCVGSLSPTKASFGVLACPLELPQTDHGGGPRAVDLCAIKLETLAVIASRRLELFEAVRRGHRVSSTTTQAALLVCIGTDSLDVDIASARPSAFCVGRSDLVAAT